MRTRSRLRALLPAASIALAVAAAGGLPGGIVPAWAATPPVPGPGTTIAAGAPPLPKGVTGAAFVVADLDTGDILAAKDAHHRLLPASTLKVLTGLTLIPRIPKFSTVVPSFADVNIEGSRVGIVENASYPAYQLFRAMLMVSGNDAANAIAHAAGGQAATAVLMNAEAQRIGATDTHAVNPSGLDAPGQVTTAYDLALIGRAAMQLPDFRAYVATKRSTINGRNGHPLSISSHDKLLYNYDGAIGIKNGYTIKAGATFVGAATRGGHSLIVTVLHAQPRVWPEVAHLLDWGFAAESLGVTPLGRLAEPTAPAPAMASAGGAPVRPAVPHIHPPAPAPDRSLELAGLLSVLVLIGLRLRARRRQQIRRS